MECRDIYSNIKINNYIYCGRSPRRWAKNDMYLVVMITAFAQPGIKIAKRLRHS